MDKIYNNVANLASATSYAPILQDVLNVYTGCPFVYESASDLTSIYQGAICAYVCSPVATAL